MKYTVILCMLLASYAFWQHFSLQKSQEHNLKLQQQNEMLLQQQQQLKKQTEEYNAAQQTNKFPSSEIWRKKIRIIAIIILFPLLILNSCAVQTTSADNPKIINTCRQAVITYGDAVECMIMLDEAQYAQ